MDPITREEMYLAAAAGYAVDPPEPITRKEVFLAKLAGMEVDTPVPYTRQERFIEAAAAVSANKAVIEPLEITENGTYTAPDGVDGYNPVTVNVDPTKITILKEQEISGFALDADLGYSVTDPAPAYTIEEGETYFVVWDGVTYETTAQKADSFIPGALLIGNGENIGLPGKGEPFAIGYVNGMVLYTAFDDPKESHRIGIYQKVSVTSDDVRYVTFMSYDGLVEYGKKAVAVGDDCADPIARGIFATPTKESDVTYDYRFVNWASEVDGEVDNTWNKAILEDKTVYAVFETCGGSIGHDADNPVYWSLSEDGKTLTISGTGKMKSYSYIGDSLLYHLRSSVKSVIIQSGVTEIGSRTFADFTALTSVTIPDSVTVIFNEAFTNCTSLTSVTIPSGTTRIWSAFEGSGLQYAYFNKTSGWKKKSIFGSSSNVSSSTLSSASSAANLLKSLGIDYLSCE